MTWDELQGTQWEGTCELWEDPLGDVVQKSSCTIAFDAGVLTYTWSYKAAPHVGKLKLDGTTAEYSDTWHQQTAVACQVVEPRGSIVTVQYTYMETWGWRINLCQRPEPAGELVLQMTNIAPWGEEARAVRMICKPA